MDPIVLKAVVKDVVTKEDRCRKSIILAWDSDGKMQEKGSNVLLDFAEKPKRSKIGKQRV